METLDNRYELIEKLGRGGMGVVWRVRDRLTSNYIALKRVLASQESIHFSIMEGSIGDFRLSLAQEFSVLASLRHPNIISVLDYGFDDEMSPYFTMELLENTQTITEVAESMDERGKVGLLIELLQALVYLHRHRMVHRDLKPDNILVADGRVRVLDFGLSVGRQEIDSSGKIVGTMGYIAPEVIAHNQMSEIADLYSVGVIAYQIFAGQLPFPPHDLYAIVNHLPDMDPVQANTELQLVIARLLDKDPYDRFFTAQETITALNEAIEEEADPEAQEVRESFLQNAPFIGRENELSKLTTALETMVHTRNGSAWLIAGESGVGKSRLLDELRVRALVNNALVLYGRAEKEDIHNYNLWRNPLQRLILHLNLYEHEAAVLQELIPNIQDFVEYDVIEAPPISPSAHQKRLMVTISQVIERYNRPLLLLLEDLHWLQLGVLEFIRHISALTDKNPLMVVATYRDDEDPYLYGQLSKMELIQLQRFSLAELESLAVAMLGAEARKPELIDLLNEQTEGNAFFAVEIVRALAEDVGSLRNIGIKSLPEEIFTRGIFNFALRRLTQLPLDYQPMLRLAAVIGREVDFALMEYIDDEMDYADWLMTCYDASLLDVEGETWRFAHDKLREGILQSLDPKQRPQLNALAAEAIEETYPDNLVYVQALLEHWRIAGNIPKTIHYTTVVADQLLKIGQGRKASRVLEKGIRMVKSLSDDKIIQHHSVMLNKLANVYWVMSDFEKAADRYKLANEVAVDANNKSSEAIALTGLAEVERLKGNYNRAREHTSNALLLWHQLDEKNGIAHSLQSLGSILRQQGYYEDAIEYLNEAQNLYMSQYDVFDAALLDNQLFLCHMQLGDLASAQRQAGSMAVLLEENDSPLIRAFHLRNQGLLAQAETNFTKARRFFNRSMDRFEELGNRLGTGMSLLYLGTVSLEMGEFSTARSYLSNAGAILRDIGVIPYTALAYSYSARLWLAWDDPENAQDAIADGLTLITEAPSLPTTLHLIHTAARWAYERSDSKKAIQYLAILLEHSEQPAKEKQLANSFMGQLLNILGAETAKQHIHSGFKTIDDAISDILVECAEIY